MDKKELIDWCKKGDEQALSLLYKTYANRMMKICLRYVSDRQIAQDLLHDGFIIIFTSIATLRQPDKLESWMGMIMKNISLRYLNQRNAVNTISLSDIQEWEEPTDILPTNNFPSYNLLFNAIEQLPDGYRKVFKLAVLEGLSHKEIGSLLGIAPHSSSSQLFRAKEMLRKFIIGCSLILMLLLLFMLPVNIWLNTKKEVIKERKKTELKKKTNKQKAETPIGESTESPLLPIHDIQYAQLKTNVDTTEHEAVRADSIAETKLIQLKDTSNLTVDFIFERRNKNLPHTANIHYSSNKKENWSLALSYSGGESRANTLHSTIPNNISSEVPEEVEERVHHYMPVSFSLSLYKKLNDRWGMEIGVRYSHLRTDFTTIGKTSAESIQRINYVGIPVKGIMQIGKYGKFSIYTSAGMSLDIPIKATLEETSAENGQTTEKKQITNAPLEWSISLGAGFQYNISPTIGIYVEPNLHCYLNNGSKLNTIRKEQPLNVSLPIGIRFSW